MIEKLNLQEREEDDLIFNQEFPHEIEEAKFMALAMVHTNKPFKGPWLFRDHGVLIEKYDGYTRYDEVVLDKLAVWIQIVDLPPLFGKEHVVQSLTKKVGTVEKVMLNPRWGDGRIVRIRVKLDIHESLMRYVSITKDKKKVYYSVLYKKMPVFCYVCGHMGHTYLEHGNGKHDPQNME
ncbi:hypothetical protein D1007_23368 [Hordeum vulgare]|nr:hypothetical protein D1007_23368 [Hordeum vulgare]